MLFCSENRMDILEESRDGIVVVSPQGRIDCNTSAKLERKLLALLEPASRGIVIDFTAVDYISSAGLRVVLVLAKRLQMCIRDRRRLAAKSGGWC